MSTFRRTLAFLLTAIPVLVALTFSSLLFVDYLRPMPVFCDVGGGCDRIKATSYAAFHGIPTPAFGVAALIVLGLLAFTPGAVARALQFFGATVAGMLATYLIVTQFKLGVFCKLCLVVDVSFLILLLGSVVRSIQKLDPPFRLAPLFAIPLLVSAIAGPVAMGFSKKIPFPQEIEAEIRRTPPGKVTVVDFVDFECPFCRMTHQTISPMLQEHASRVRLVRKQVPLKMHAHAHDAARAACCAERFGQEEQMANRLFTAEDLTPEGCEAIAASLGLDMERFRECIKDPAIDARIEAETAEFKAIRGRGLPTIFIGGKRLEGAQPAVEYEKALNRSLAGKS